MPNVAHELPKGVAVIFFENVGWLNEGGDFASYNSEGYYVVGYTCNKNVNHPGPKARITKLKNNRDLVALKMQLALLNKERVNIILFGLPDELMSVQDALRVSLESGKPLVIKTNMEKCDHLPYWWSEEK